MGSRFDVGSRFSVWSRFGYQISSSCIIVECQNCLALSVFRGETWNDIIEPWFINKQDRDTLLTVTFGVGTLHGVKSSLKLL